MKLIFTLIIGFLLFNNRTFAQEELLPCKQNIVQAQLPMTPERIARLKAFDEQQKAVQEMMKNHPPTRQIYTIPVVFHVIGYGGQENISDEQIYDAMDVLNRDYNLQNADANNVVYDFNASNPSAVATPADIEIHFVLAKKAPDGTCFNGITRTTSPTTFSTSNGFVQLDAVINGNNVYRGLWPSKNYLNIIVAKNIGNAAGYTFLPGSFNGTNMYGSIWVDPTYVGRIGTGSEVKSRTLTHEVGHWLNLNHVWGPTNDPGLLSNCSTDDGVTDTPNTIGSTTCKLTENSCGPLANVENYMDYSYCSKMFTHGQRDRMWAALQVAPRDFVWTPANLALTGVDGNLGLCSADFDTKTNKIAYCIGEPIDFKDESEEGQTSWNWQFDGGTPSTSSLQNPTVTYSTPGKYKVSLTVSDGTTSITKTKDQYITINKIDTLPYFESFENYNHAGEMTDVTIRNITPNAGTFDIANNIAATGTKSLSLMNYYFTDPAINEYISPNFDLSTYHNPDKITLTFKYAYRKKNDSSINNKESLNIYVSSNCGDTWDIRKTMLSSQLSTIIEPYSYIASQSDFITVHVLGITAAYFKQFFQFKFGFQSGGGNNLYLDDINLYQGAPSDHNVVNTIDIQANPNKEWFIQPNPAQHQTTIIFNMNTDEIIPLKIVDNNGKIVLDNIIKSAKGTNEILLDVSNFPSGMYHVKLGNDVHSLIVK